MKRVFMPLLAVVIAATGAFNTAVARLILVDVNVTANPAVCSIDGTCDQTGGTCQITSGGNTIVFYVVGPGVPCGTVIATGKFKQI